MLNFQCNFCETDIQADYAYIGEFVQCPLCETHLIVPDPILPYKSDFEGYLIEKMRASTLLWNTYEVSSADGEGNAFLSLMRVPGAFFLKRVSDFNEFANTVIRSGAINVPGIPHLKHYSLVPGKIFFIFEHFQSYDLENFIVQNGPLDPFTALELVKRIAETLSKVWSKDQTIHQNLIPRNIRVNNKLESRIMNTGLSQYLLKDPTLLEQGFNIWDPRYMSPEFSLKGKGDSPACDIYALGGMLYFMITGKHPYLNVPIEEIPKAPVPEMQAEVPREIVTLVQLMMAKQTAVRLKNWDEVIERVDATFAKTQGIPKMKKFADKYSKHSSSSPIKPTGLSHIRRGAGTEKIRIKKQVASKKAKMTDTIAKLVTPKLKRSVNSTWMRHKRQERKSGGAQNFVGLIIVIFIALSIGLPILIFVVRNHMEKNKKKANITQNNPVDENVNTGNTATNPDPVNTNPVNVNPPVDNTTPNPDPNATTTPNPNVAGTNTKTDPIVKTDPVVTTVPKNSLQAELAAIEEFYKNNPDKGKEALAKYDNLHKKAINENRIDMVDAIESRVLLIKMNPSAINNVAQNTDVPGNTDNTKNPQDTVKIDNTDVPKNIDGQVKIVIKALVENVNPLLEKKEYEKAISMLQDYEGALAEESLPERNKIIKKIQDKIQENKLKNDNITGALAPLVEKLAPFLLEKKFMEAEIQLQLVAKDKKSKLPKHVLKDWTKQVSDYKTLSQKYNDSENADEIIGKENKLLEKAFLVRGLLYYEKGQFTESVAEFEKVPYKGGAAFISGMDNAAGKESFDDSVKGFKAILKEYDFTFDPKNSDELLIKLTEIKLPAKEAASLAESVNVFANDKKNSVFTKKYMNIIEALGIYCKTLSGKEIKVK